MTILNRVGAEADQTRMLASEFQKAFTQSAKLLESLVARMPDVTRESFRQRFLSSTNDGMQQLLGLLTELNYVKNYMIDHKSIRK